MTMKVLAVNSSPKMAKGNTALVLNPFLEGMRETGAEVELFHTNKLKINPCQGEFNCRHTTPGKCFQKDDMQMLLPKLARADIWVFASPVYVDGISGPMKNLMDRMIPLMESAIELLDGHCRKSPREGVKRGKAVLVSSCGFWEMDNFDPLIVHMKAMCKNFGREFAGALLRPHGPVLMKAVEGMRKTANDILEAVKEAGCQLVRDGAMETETLNIVTRELLPLDKYVQASNRGYQQALKTLVKNNTHH